MERGGNLEIYTVVAERADPVNLTNNLATDGTHSWLPDGARIALASDRDGGLEIYALHLDTVTPARLSVAAAMPEAPPAHEAEHRFDMRGPFCYSSLQNLYKACRAWGHSSVGRAHQSH